MSRPRLRLILNLLVLALSLYGIYQKDPSVAGPTIFESLMTESFAPMQRGIFYVREEISSFIDHYLFMVDADIENNILRKRVLDLENTIYQLEELRRENIRLKDLLSYGQEIPREKILAQIVGWDSSSQYRVLRVNKGKEDGVVLKSSVITSQGLVGHVYRLTPHHADIITILDQNMRVDALVDRTRSHGIVEGFSPTLCVMKYVTRTEPVSVGDQVITSGLGNIYPKGVRVGTISRIERESYGITQLIEVTPSVDFRKLEEVLIIKAPPGEGINEKEIDVINGVQE